MLPIGHLAGGYLAGKIAARFIPALNQPEYLALSAFFGFAPDLDFFIAFAKSKKMILDKRFDHHKYLSHAPLVYLAVFALWYSIFPATRLVAWTFILGTWSHLLIDTFTIGAGGTMWFYPFSKKQFGVQLDESLEIIETRFWRYWWNYTKEYLNLNIFKVELTVVIISILVLIFK